MKIPSSCTAVRAAGTLKSVSRSPLRQCAAVAAAALIGMIMCRLAGDAGGEWFIGAGALLFYAVVNSILFIPAEHPLRYASSSLLSFAALFAVMPVCALAVSAKGYEEIGPDAMVYLVIIYYPFLFAAGAAVRLALHVFRRKSRRQFF